MKNLFLLLAVIFSFLNSAEPAVANKRDIKPKDLYNKCITCHGKQAEKKALGKSDIIANWDAAKIENALKGYKAGLRNKHGMGGVMKGQVISLSDEEIKKLSVYISKFAKNSKK